MDANDLTAAGNFVGDTTKAGGKSVGMEQKDQNQSGTQQ